LGDGDFAADPGRRKSALCNNSPTDVDLVMRLFDAYASRDDISMPNTASSSRTPPTPR
jgi:hypothetical protein